MQIKLISPFSEAYQEDSNLHFFFPVQLLNNKFESDGRVERPGQIPSHRMQVSFVS